MQFLGYAITEVVRFVDSGQSYSVTLIASYQYRD